VHEGVVVNDVVLFEDLDGGFGGEPRGGGPAAGRFSGEAGNDFDGFGEDGAFLVFCEFGDEFVGVAVEAAGMD
jgi:hypothetical protein